MLHNYSHYTVLESVLKPKELIKEAEQLGEKYCGICDVNTMAGVVQFYEAAKVSGIKPALGFTGTMMNGGRLTLFAKNKRGFLTLFKILSDCNSEKNFIRFPQLTLTTLKEYEGELQNIICLDGNYGSVLFNLLTYNTHNDLIEIDNHIAMLRLYFGAENLFLERYPELSYEHAEVYSRLEGRFGIKSITSNVTKFKNDAHGKYLYDVIRCKQHKTTIDRLPSDAYYYCPLQNTDDSQRAVFDMIEEYDILSPPALPKFSTPNNVPAIDYLKEVCRVGYREKIPERLWQNSAYSDQIKFELDVFQRAGLSGTSLSDYFLILWDIIKYAESCGYLIGPGRGSSSGCLISYLMGVTKLDPLEHGLIFSRFYSDARKGSLPDIDTDFPIRSREHIIKYIQNKYGFNKVAQIATYQTFMGRAALKEIFRAEGRLGYSDMNEITKQIEDKNKISDKLQEMKEAGKEPSVILWALENKGHKLSNWVQLEDDGTLTGTFATQFDHAIRLEGIKAAVSKHAAGVVIAQNDLSDVVPMLYDSKSKEQIVGLEYEDAEKLSCVKLDCLGLNVLDKLEDIQKYC